MTTPTRSPHAVPGLYWLCILLWLAGLLFSLTGLYLLVTGALPLGLLALGVGLLSAGAGIGLYRMKRWGVILFGVLGLAGSINHLSSILLNDTALSQSDPAEVLSALFNVLIAILIPIGLIYLIIIFWRRMV